MKMKFLSLICTAGLLVACGSGGSDSSKAASLSDLVGVWDATETIEGKKDIAHIVIKSDGSFREYDFQGDEYDKGEKCYKVFSGKLVDQGDGKFKDEDGDIMTITKNGDSLTSEVKEGNTVSKTTVFLSPKKESDFTPECS